MLAVISLQLSCQGGRKQQSAREQAPSEATVPTDAYLYDLHIVDGKESHSARAELYAHDSIAVLRLKGFLGTLGAVIIAYQDTLGIYLPRQKEYSLMSAADGAVLDSCQALWQLWPLLLHPSLTPGQLDSLRQWTIVNHAADRQQLLWQQPLCSITVTAKARLEDERWFFEELKASQASGYVMLTLKERRQQALVPVRRFSPPDTTGWGKVAAQDLMLSLD